MPLTLIAFATAISIFRQITPYFATFADYAFAALRPAAISHCRLAEYCQMLGHCRCRFRILHERQPLAIAADALAGFR